MKRREFVRSTLSAGAVLLIVPRALRASAAPPVMTVYKSPLCGCCGEWVKHVEGAGFTVNNPNAVSGCGCGSSFKTADDSGKAQSCSH